MAKPDACYIGMTVIIALVFIVLESILIGTAPSKTFLNPSDPQFIVGYVFFMILIIFIVNVFVVYNAYYDTKLYYILLFANIIVICTILGATLVGISPSHAFVPSNPMFLAGFSFLIMMAIVVSSIIIIAILSVC